MFWSGVGTGLREPCSPYRSANVYGAPLNTPNADGWNCIPELLGPSLTFDLSQLPENREAIVGIAADAPLPGGTYYCSLYWYRGDSAEPFYRFNTRFDVQAGGGLYVYSYIAKAAWEINRSGAYRLYINIGGPQNYVKTITFNVSGVTAVVPTVPVIGQAIQGLIDGFQAVSTFFYNIYLHVFDWVWPFNLAAEPFYQVSALFVNMTGALTEFNTWVSETTDFLAGVLSWDGIKSLILEWLPGLAEVIAWFTSWWDQVLAVIAGWWEGALVTIRGLIDVATQGLTDLLTKWDNFWVSVLPNLVNWTWLTSWWNSRLADVQGLINSAIAGAAPFWAGWQEIRATVLEFFQDPIEWLWQRFTDWFLGPEE